MNIRHIIFRKNISRRAAMSLTTRIRAMFSRDIYRYTITSGKHGLLFQSPYHDMCRQGKAPALIQNQYIILQMLCEYQEAEEGNGFLVPCDTACSLDEGTRALLGLPGPWPGTFELFTRGQTFRTGGFKPTLRLLSEDGRKLEQWELDGAYLHVGPKSYLPSSAQYLALSAIQDHHALPLEKQTEGANLAVVYALQKADKAGARIDLRHFHTITVEEAEHLRLSILEQKDGSLHLVPEFGLGLSPEDIEERLHQLQGGDTVCLRIKNTVVLLDEKKLLGIQEILNHQHIPPQERENFLKAPAGFLHASLVDLDNGFSIRVQGEELFHPAYFGETDARRSDWFGNEETGSAILLESALSLLDSTQKKEEFLCRVEEATASGKHSLEFAGFTVLLPTSPEEREGILQKLRETPPASPASDNSQEKLTIAVALNDDVPFNVDFNIAPKPYYWEGPLPFDTMNFTPFAYQEEGIRWMVGHALHAVTDGIGRFEGALLADDMGLGKTFMTLAGLNAWQNIMHQREGTQYVAKPVLVIAPVVLLENWKEEIDKVFAVSPFKDTVVLQANGDLKRFRTDEVRDGVTKHALKIGKTFGYGRLDLPGRIVLTNYETLRLYPFSLCSVDWGMVVFDEAQAIKNPNALSSRAAKGLKADFRLAVTGTPVENQLIDFWNIFDTISPGMLDTCQQFRKNYIHPILASGGNNDVRKKTGTELRNVVSHFMLRRTKEDKLSDALPKKHTFTGENTASLAPVMTGEQRAAYDAVSRKVSDAKLIGKKIMTVLLPALKELRDISLHPKLASSLDLPMPTTLQEADALIHQSGKLSVMTDILKQVQRRDEKIIIFVINRKMQCFLAAALRLLFPLPSISIINGETRAVSGEKSGTETRKTIIKQFEQQPGFGIIIMSPLAAGVGLTVVGANNVIHLERHWNPAKEAQASDRVYRIGQKKDVNIYIPILDHPERLSFDRNLHELLKHKIDIKDAVVTPEEVKPEDFNIEELFVK